MVRKLAAQDLVSHRPYGPVALTEAGRRRAASIIRRHRLIETWLVREFGYAWDEVHDEAEVLEHAVSDLLIERIEEKGDRRPPRTVKPGFRIVRRESTGFPGRAADAVPAR